jgi:phosphopantothenoylcysteine synthetase/decarboxylase
MVRALEKMKDRRCDFMVVNTPLSESGHGFGKDSVAAAVLSDEQTPKQLVLKEKNELAVDLVRIIAARLNRKAS